MFCRRACASFRTFVRWLLLQFFRSFVLSFKMHFRTWDFIAFNMTFARLCSIHFTRSLSLLFSIKTTVLPFISRSRSELSIFHIFKKHFIMLEVEPLLLSFSTKTLKLYSSFIRPLQYGQSFSHFFFLWLPQTSPFDFIVIRTRFFGWNGKSVRVQKEKEWMKIVQKEMGFYF